MAKRAKPESTTASPPSAAAKSGAQDAAPETPPSPEALARNLVRAGLKAQELAAANFQRIAEKPFKGPLDPLNISGALVSLTKAMGTSRETVAEAQKAWWRDVTLLWERTALKVMGGEAKPLVEPSPGDRRFRAEEWRSNEIFDFVKQSYLLTANAMQDMVAGLEGLSPEERRRVAFFTKQFTDAFAPTNFPLTNPDVLKATLAWMAQKKDARIHSATFWAAQTDFSEAGDLQVFVDDAQLEALQKQMQESGGVLKGSKMAGAFNMLRANDLIWSFVINNYMLGKDVAPFDLLYWNSDTTRMPEKLHLSYLRNCYRDNALAKGEMEMGGVRLDLSKVKVPIYLQSAKEDHIAPARSVYKAVQLFSGPVRFILAGSGHIAGVINPPAAGKYQYWTNDRHAPDFDAWLPGAKETAGSWWPDWSAWLSKLSGDQVPARQPGDGKLKPIGDAPGTYVKVKAQ